MMRRARLGVFGVVLLSVSIASAQSAPAPTPSPTGSPGPTPTPTPAPAADRTEEAKGLFTAGRAAFDSGRFNEALDYFQRSYAMSQRPELLYNIGIVHDRLRDDQRALDAFDAYLAAVPDAPNRQAVETRAAAIRNALAARKAQEPAQAPTPAEAAATMQTPTADVSAIETDTNPPEDDDSLVKQWWFWTAIGVVVAGGVTAGVLVASSGDAEPASPLPPKGGVVVTTLGAAK